MHRPASPLASPTPKNLAAHGGNGTVPTVKRPLPEARPSVRGKFLFAGDTKLFVKGVTYGTFRPNERGEPYPEPETVREDFRAMRRAGINSVRVYTVPPVWLLDLARECGLYVMVGLPWEQHVTFLDDDGRAGEIERRVREGVRRCAGHPAVLSFAVGNEIPSRIVRWHGRGAIEAFLERLCRGVKAEDPGALVTYVNYPPTEYLQVPFVDFASFNVYLEEEETLAAYLARLQTLADDLPLVMAEVGMDSRRNGCVEQAETLDWQIQSVFEAGCAGLFLFSWTDEWYRGGHEIDDWDFGLTTREREPKPALTTVSDRFARVPFDEQTVWPEMSVVVCSYNGAATIEETLVALEALEYPSYEIIVVDDGSTDATAQIARRFPIYLIQTENRGLSAARNTGLEAARGEIVAYIDDDAYPDPHWLHYLAQTFEQGGWAAVGGPNVSPPDDGFVAQCVGRAPGNPTHVLLSDREAEHIPGCNMAFRRRTLASLGGFDEHFRVAGDDVDLCWQLRDDGHRIGFSPSAVVWHHRRGRIRDYWRQQRNYGCAEALLEAKWPEKYNLAGHANWNGRVYQSGWSQLTAFHPSRIYYGVWGSALFQSIYTPEPSNLSWLLLTPEWYLLIGLFGAVSAAGLSWPPLLTAGALSAGAFGLLTVRAASEARRATRGLGGAFGERAARGALTAGLHLAQPLARLAGRLHRGLRPWRRHGRLRLCLPRVRTLSLWSPQWRSARDWLESAEHGLRNRGMKVARGRAFDRWDLDLSCGLLGSIRLLMTLEEHGEGRQLVRFRTYPRSSVLVWGLAGLLTALSVAALLNGGTIAFAALGGLSALLLGRLGLEWSCATGAVVDTVKSMDARSSASEDDASLPAHTVSVHDDSFPEDPASAPEGELAH